LKTAPKNNLEIASKHPLHAAAPHHQPPPHRHSCLAVAGAPFLSSPSHLPCRCRFKFTMGRPNVGLKEGDDGLGLRGWWLRVERMVA